MGRKACSHLRRTAANLALGIIFTATGCAAPADAPLARPSVAPTAAATQPAALLSLEDAKVRPMYREMMAVDLPTVSRVALARGIDVREAQQRVTSAEGRYESSVEAVFPVIAPAFAYQHFDGANQNANGTLVLTNFNNILPAVTVQWIVNPGRVYYDIVAARRRLDASRRLSESAELDTLRTAAVQYYDLVLAQAKVAVARKAEAEATEALRLTARRVRAAVALPADESRARASLAGRRQDLLLAVNDFYQASVALTLTLDLDPTITLVPAPREVAQTTLVREDLDVDRLLGLAVRYRPDLRAARELLAAADADEGAVTWGALGPQLQAAYTYGGLQTRVHGNTSPLYEQQRGSASAGFALGLSTFGQMKIAKSDVRTAALRVERQLIELRGQVVAAQQSSATAAAVIPIAQEQVRSAEDALRLAQANLNAGTMLLLDVLQAEDEVDAARLRYAQAVVHYNQHQVNLLASLGLMDAERISVASSAAPTTAPAATTQRGEP
jgi:outer membrane protein TolC